MSTGYECKNCGYEPTQEEGDGGRCPKCNPMPGDTPRAVIEKREKQRAKREETAVAREANEATRAWATARIGEPGSALTHGEEQGPGSAALTGVLQYDREVGGYVRRVEDITPARAERARVVREILIGLTSPFALSFREERVALLAKAKDYNITASELLAAARDTRF